MTIAPVIIPRLSEITLDSRIIGLGLCATLLTGVAWSYVKVPQVEFGKLQATDLADVVLAFGVK